MYENHRKRTYNNSYNNQNSRHHSEKFQKYQKNYHNNNNNNNYVQISSKPGDSRPKTHFNGPSHKYTDRFKSNPTYNNRYTSQNKFHGAKNTQFSDPQTRSNKQGENDKENSQKIEITAFSPLVPKETMVTMLGRFSRFQNINLSSKSNFDLVILFQEFCECRPQRVKKHWLKQKYIEK